MAIDVERLRLLGDRVLVKRVPEQEKTQGGIYIPDAGIYIPDAAKEKPIEGEVLVVGPGKMLECGDVYAIDLAVGDRVFFTKYGGSEIKVEGNEFIILRADDILAVLPSR